MKLFFLPAAILLLSLQPVCGQESVTPVQRKSRMHHVPSSLTNRVDGMPINDPNVLRADKAAAAANPTPGNGILYHGGSVMTSTVTVYYIWYGDWNGNDGIALLESLAGKIGGSSYFNMNSSYTDGNGTPVSNSVLFGGSTTDSYSVGKNLSDQQIWQVVSTAINGGKLPKDPNGMYFVLTSADVTATSGFCTQYCGWHTYGTLSGTPIKFAFVGDSSRCISGCAAQSTSPNGNPGADGMASVIAHELSETVTDPTLNAWYDNNGNENADKCAWTFGVTFAATNGSRANVTLGKYNYLIQQNWINASGGECGLQYVVPVANSISPASSAAGAVVPITVTGTNFAAGANLTISGTGITTSNLTVVNSTTISATLNIAASASVGAHTVAVTMGAGVSAPLNFTVSSTSVTVTGLTPATGVPATTVPFTLAGTNFAAGATVQVSGTGVAVSGVSVVSATQIKGQLTIDKAAAPGSRNLTVTVGSSVSAPATFTIIGPTITITSVSPATGVTGSSVQVTLTGTNFGAGVTLIVSGSGVAASNVVVTGTTQIKAQLTIDKAAAAGTRSLTVNLASATSGSADFTVISTTPTLSGVTPTSGPLATTVPFTLTGTNFVTGATVQVSGRGVAVSGVSVVNPTQIKGQLTIDKAAAPGSRNLTVTVGTSVSTSMAFTVTVPVITITSVSPATGAAGGSVPVTLTGTNFCAGATLTVSGSGVTASNVVVTGTTQIKAQLTIDRAAAAGTRSLTVNLASATSGSADFAVTSSAPTVSGISPASGTAGSSVPITLTGTNLLAGATVAVSGSGVAVSGVTVVSATQINAQLTIDKSASLGARSVTVSAGSAVTGAQSFSITAAPTGPVPAINSMSPGGYGTGLTTGAAIYGSNLAAGAKVNFSGTGVSATNVSVNSGSLITFNLSIDANATVGPRSVTVVTAAGTSAPYPFIVNPAGPIVNNVTPSSGTTGATVTMTLTGTGFTPNSYIVANATGVVVGKTVVVSPTQMTVQLTLGGSTGQRFLLVVIPSSQYVITSTPVYFMINAATGSH